MNLAQMANRVCAEWLSVRSAGEMDDQNRQLLRDAMQTGFGQYFAEVPTRFRTVNYSGRFGAALTGTAAVTAGSQVVTFSGVTPVEGATVEIAGDSVVNQAYRTPSGAYRLEMPYGGTTGTQVATVQRDTAILPWNLSGIITAPRDMRSGGPELPEIEPGSVWPVAINDWRTWAAGLLYIGYRIEHSGQYSILRIIPPPTGDYPVTMVAEIENLSFSGIGALTDVLADAIPVNDDHCVRLVAPLIAEALMTHPLFRDPNMQKSAMQKAERARADIALLRDRPGAGPSRIIAPCP